MKKPRKCRNCPNIVYGRREICDDCRRRIIRSRARIRKKKWYNRMTDRERKLRNRNMQLSRYGLNNDDFLVMLEQQGGLCAICRKPPRPGRKLSVDHNHKTGQIRGLLCTRCNNHVAIVENKLDEIRKYLDQYEGQNANHSQSISG